VKRRVIGVVLVGAALLAAGGYALSGREGSADSPATRPSASPSATTGPTPLPNYVEDLPAARLLAGQACALLADFHRQVEANDPASTVRRTLGQLESTALQAYSHDVRWIRLLSAAQALSEALRNDDGDAAALGITTADQECARLG
jgi:hypothetical protein